MGFLKQRCKGRAMLGRREERGEADEAVAAAVAFRDQHGSLESKGLL